MEWRGTIVGGHAVRMNGWGTEGGQDFWLVATRFGMNGETRVFSKLCVGTTLLVGEKGHALRTSLWGDFRSLNKPRFIEFAQLFFFNCVCVDTCVSSWCLLFITWCQIICFRFRIKMHFISLKLLWICPSGSAVTVHSVDKRINSCSYLTHRSVKLMVAVVQN